MSKTSILANTRIRLANTNDAAAILAIYAPFCLADSPVSFEFAPPTIAEMAERIERTLASLPWLVWVEDDKVAGYAYASAHRQRAAYQWSVDVSAYIDAGKRKTGVGSGLYSSLFEILRLQGYFNAYAGITLPNPASVRLHEKMGFSQVGTYREVGYKGKSWHDVAWYELFLQTKVVNPSAPTPLPQIDVV